VRTNNAYNIRYAFHYKCPQVFCYDGLKLLILRFKAKDRNDIKTCKPDVFVIPNIATDGPPIRYALYRLITDGLHRVMAQNPLDVIIGVYERKFDWYNGRPYWMAGGLRYDTIPGVTRQISQGRWAWFNQGQFHAWCSYLS
jgi:hypothetical protein